MDRIKKAKKNATREGILTYCVIMQMLNLALLVHHSNIVIYMVSSI
jgi:hypothetical protein